MRSKPNLSPRNRGLAILVGCSTCVALNLYVMRAWGEFYVFLFPFAFALAPVGLILLVTGRSTTDLRTGNLPIWAGQVMLALMVIGAVLGFVANHAVKK
jgi:hypothetical protein